MTINNKWFRGAIPALLIHSCIGSVYCWSLLKNEIAEQIGCAVSSIEMAFSLAIFFLGMSAAFGGRFVEKNVKQSSVLSCVCFVSGLLGSIYAIRLQSIPLLLLFYGCIMGIGLGIGYLSPVKTLMLWFSKHKGVATGIAISGFGLSKVLFSPFITWCNAAHGVTSTLLYMAAISSVLMVIAAWLIKKPADWKEEKNTGNVLGIVKILFNPTYIKIWVIFYLNITCGLAIIAFEKDLASIVGITAIGLLSSLTALFNTLGRFCYSSASDWLKNKSIIYMIIFISSVAATLANGIIDPMTAFLIIVGLCIINAGYGGGFSTLPTLLQSKFGMKNISTIHGFALSAWAWAGLSGNQLSNVVLNHYKGSFHDLFIILAALYGIAGLVTYSLLRERRKTEYEDI